MIWWGLSLVRNQMVLERILTHWNEKAYVLQYVSLRDDFCDAPLSVPVTTLSFSSCSFFILCLCCIAIVLCVWGTPATQLPFTSKTSYGSIVNMTCGRFPYEHDTI